MQLSRILGALGGPAGRARFLEKVWCDLHVAPPILILLQKVNFSSPLSLLVTPALAFATVSHAGCLAHCWRRSGRLSQALGAWGGRLCDCLRPWAPWAGTFATVSDLGRAWRWILRLSQTLGALGGHFCDCLAFWAPWAVQQDERDFLGENLVSDGLILDKKLSELRPFL